LPAGELAAAHWSADGGDALRHFDLLGSELLCQQADVADHGMAPEQRAGEFCMLLDEDRRAPFGVAAKRRSSAHPHAFGSGGGDVVTDALGRDLAFELREAQQHVQGEPAHAGGGVERLRDRGEAGAGLVGRFDQPGEVEQRAGQPVDLVDDDVDLARGDVCQQWLQGRALECSARDTTVIVLLGQNPDIQRLLSQSRKLALVHVRGMDAVVESGPAASGCCPPVSRPSFMRRSAASAILYRESGMTALRS